MNDNTDNPTTQPDPATIQQAALRSRISTQHGITKEDAALFLNQTDEATMQTVAARLAERLYGPPNPLLKGNIAPREGNSTKPPKGHSLADFASQLFNRREY